MHVHVCVYTISFMFLKKFGKISENVNSDKIVILYQAAKLQYTTVYITNP